jgi:hypothetical protein
MRHHSRNGVIGAALIGVGCGLTVAGLVMVIPVCTNWSLGLIGQAGKKWRETVHTGVETAASFAGQVTGMAQKRFGEASKTARERTAKAAAAVESAARHVREHAS